MRRRFPDDTTDVREGERGGEYLWMVAFATLSFVASLYSPGTLVSIGETAFGGFAQLTLPVALALYWRGTNRWGMLAGVAGSQAFYLANVFTGFVPATIFVWDASLYGMALGVLLTVGMSLWTSAAPEEDASGVFEGLGAD